MADAEAKPDWYADWERSVAKWWTSVLDDPQFVKGMGDQLAGRAQMRSAWEENIDRTMHQMHLPSKTDVIRIARIASLLEDRLLALEETVAEVHTRLDRVEKEVLKARVDAASALVTLTEQLGRIEARLIPASLGHVP